MTGERPNARARSENGGHGNGQEEHRPPPEDSVPPGGQAAGGTSPPDGVAEYAHAIETKAVTLDHLVDALARKRDSGDDEARTLYAGWFLDLKSTYCDQENVEESYFCQNIAGAAVLTASVHEAVPAPKPPSPRPRHRAARRGRKLLRWIRGCRQEVRHSIHVRYPTQSVLAVTPDFAGVLWQCLALSKRAAQLLRTKNSIAVHRTTYSIIVYLLSVLDTVESGASRGSETEKDRKLRIQAAIADAREQLGHAIRQYEASARWGSRYAYAKGMAVGVLCLAVGERIAFMLIPSRTVAVETLLAVIATGAMGAVVSVMTRMSSNSFHLDPLAEHSALRVLGIFRPFIGAFFGVAMFLIVDGGMLDLVPQSVESDTSKQVMFFSALAFVSGFSERFAKGVITAAEGDRQATTPPTAAPVSEPAATAS